MKFNPPRYHLLKSLYEWPNYECSCRDQSRRFDCIQHQTRLSNDPLRSNRLIPIHKWELVHGKPTEDGLWEYYFNADTNGFNKVVSVTPAKCSNDNPEGRYEDIPLKIWIHEGKFFRWQEKLNDDQ